MSNPPSHYLPLTVVAGDGASVGSTVIVDGRESHSLETNGYWFFVIDRIRLDIAFEYRTNDNQNVPEELAAIASSADASKLILFVCANGLSAANIPEGDLHAFLHKSGGGEMLLRMEQVASQLKTDGIGYALVSVMGGSAKGFETMRGGTADNGVMTLKLMKIDFDNQSLYTPARISN